SNAFKFTPDHGSVTFRITNNYSDTSVDMGEGVLKVSVIDSGQGIPQKQLARIFDHFYQVDQDVTRAFEGSGIGLALVREYVELHQGKVEVESELGTGSSFHILLPLGKGHLKDIEIHGSVGYGPRPPVESMLSDVLVKVSDIDESKPTLLLVEDNPDMRTYLSEVLHDEFSIIESANGMDGLELALEKVPDLIISDVMMPRMDGYQLCSKLKQDERTSHIPVILLTARAGDEAMLEGFEFGADDYITKPFSPAELRARVHNLMELIRSLREQYRRDNLFGQPQRAVSSIEERFLGRLMEVLEINRSNSSFGSEQFATEMGMSRSQLHRKLKALTGMAVGEFIKSYRLKYARELLERNYDNVAQVAYEAGFNSPSYFTESFKKEFGILPSEVRPKS
ncbi:MAG: response regulator, partial [Cyclobacteriaceae bacterium]